MPLITERDHSKKMKLRDHLRSYKELIAKLKKKVEKLSYENSILNSEKIMAEVKCQKLERKMKKLEVNK